MKGVDVVVVRESGDAVTVEVKGLAGNTNGPPKIWLTRNSNPQRHFVALVSFEGRIDRPEMPPPVWIVPFPDLERFIRRYPGDGST
jgi:hypothetical protein